MPRQLTPQSSLENLKREAKRWLKALRANVGDARARLASAFPNAPDIPGLRDVQHALALEHGVPGWTALKNLLSRTARPDANPDPVERFLEYACPDHHARGGPAHRMARHAAMRLLSRYPEIAHDSLYTAVVCGDLTEVERRLAARPEAAVEKRSATGHSRSGAGGSEDLFKDNGPKGWEPLQFLCFTRLPLDAANDNAVAIARALLDRGADPNAYFMAGDSRYTPLVGVIGEGEEDRPPHPRRDELARLLLERGAEPFDGQVVYNIHFHGDVRWFLKLIYEFSVKAGRKADWDDPNWSMLDMGGYGNGARWHLDIAIGNNDLELAEWVLAHGANPNAAPARDKRFRQRTPHEEALRHGLTEMAELLVRYGATPSAASLEGEEAFTAACFGLDRAQAQQLLASHSEYLRSHVAMFAAAKRDRADVVAFLLDLGMSPDVADRQKQTPLHVAAYADSLRVATLLIERGAEIDAVDAMHDATPLWWAMWGQRQRMVELLSAYSRDVWALSFTGNVARLREVLSAEPRLATLVGAETTPLMWLPEDEARAIEIVELFLAHGADPSIKDKEGQMAADRAEKRGMLEVAAILRSDASPPSRPTLGHYEKIAEDLLKAYRTGDSRASQSVWDHFGHKRTLEATRRYVRVDLGKRENEDVDISLEDARLLVARGHRFESWQALAEYAGSLPGGKTAIASRPVELYSIDDKGARRREATSRDWDAVIAIMRDKRIPGLNAEGEMTDALLERVSHLDHVMSLQLNDSKKVTDAGLAHLARMPQLRHLDLSGCAITDRGLEVLRRLPQLEGIALIWTAVTDVGVANLSGCENLQRVDLFGTRTGDGAVKALVGKPKLRDFRSGNFVTDAGVALFHQFPVFKSWQGGDVSMSLTGFDAKPNYLLLRGPFTNTGLAELARLDGLFALNVDDATLRVTAAGLAPLVNLPNLGWLAFDTTDEAMPYIAAMPKLRFLMCQDTVAGDDGFVALSRSQSIEYIWGRRCYNLRTRGFTALSAMPALRHLSVSCRNVDDSGIATLPSFPALTELMPMDVPDAGYRHIGRCERLESLVLMYCRDTTDVATGHIAALPRLNNYFASYTQITDRTPELLSQMASLERIRFSACAGLTNAGIAALARLPRLRELDLGGMRRVTRDVTAAFPAHVQVSYSP